MKKEKLTKMIEDFDRTNRLTPKDIAELSEEKIFDHLDKANQALKQMTSPIIEDKYKKAQEYVQQTSNVDYTKIEEQISKIQSEPQLDLEEFSKTIPIDKVHNDFELTSSIPPLDILTKKEVRSYQKENQYKSLLVNPIADKESLSKLDLDKKSSLQMTPDEIISSISKIDEFHSLVNLSHPAAIDKNENSSIPLQQDFLNFLMSKCANSFGWLVKADFLSFVEIDPSSFPENEEFIFFLKSRNLQLELKNIIGMQHSKQLINRKGYHVFLIKILESDQKLPQTNLYDEVCNDPRYLSMGEHLRKIGIKFVYGFNPRFLWDNEINKTDEELDRE